MAYTYASLSDLFDRYVELNAEGITPYWCIHHRIAVFMYYCDPDGNEMEFQVDCFADNDEANALIRAFSINPIGVEYDPEEWLAEIRSGTPVEDLLRERVVPRLGRAHCGRGGVCPARGMRAPDVEENAERSG